MHARPTPQPDPATAPYWNAAREHRLVLPRCDACNQVHFYPRALCPHCGGNAFAWVAAAGQGTVYSFTTIRRAPSPAFEPHVPYVVAIVELDEGPHLMTNIVKCDADKVRIGDRVSVDFLDVDDTTLPVFHKSGGE
jgi:uncharacterized OB-fold protein